MTKHITKKEIFVFFLAIAMFCFVGMHASTVKASSVQIAPKLYVLDYYKSGNTYKAKLTWYAKKDYTYTVYRKKVGNFKAIATVKSTGSKAKYIDTNIGANAGYTYTVKQTSPATNLSYDKTGLTLLNSVNYTVDFQNTKAVIKWDKIPGATQYRVYRTREADKVRKRIVRTKGTSYVDTYGKYPSTFDDILHVYIFVDPSIRDTAYNVRARHAERVEGTKKVSKGLFINEPTFKLESPTIVSMTSSSIKWGTVPNAERYRIMKRNGTSGNWTVLKYVPQNKSKVTLTESISNVDKNAYYTVQAVAKIDGKTVLSPVDTGFTLKNRRFSNKKILFIGDSITYGTPYKTASTRHMFSYPQRIAQLTGATVYNPSVPGATYHYQAHKAGMKARHRISTQVIPQIYKGQKPAGAAELDNAKDSNGKTGTKIEDYDVVFLAAGTNDYADGTPLGSKSSTDVGTFYGSVNKIMQYIENASKARVKKDKAPIKVVFVDLFYSERIGYTKQECQKRENRDVTKNSAGLTLNSYRSALDQVRTKWGSKGTLKVYKYKTRSAGIVSHSNMPYSSVDYLHFTKHTYALYGNSMAKFLVDNVF